MAVGDETGQTLTLHRDGNLWLSRRTLQSDSPTEEHVTESVHRIVSSDAASEMLDAVDRYACLLEGTVADITPWRLEMFYGSGSSMVILGCLDLHVSELGSTLSEFIRKRLVTAPDDPHADHGIGRPFLTMLDVGTMLLFDHGRPEFSCSDEGPRGFRSIPSSRAGR